MERIDRTIERIANSLEKMLEIINIDEEICKLKDEIYHQNKDDSIRFEKLRCLGRKRGDIKQSLRVDIRKLKEY